METGRWGRARELFDRAQALPEAERAAFVASNTGDDASLRSEVESLLDALAEAGGFLAGTNVGALTAPPSDEAAETSRVRIGPWRVVGELGRGGMGIVYLGERAAGDYEQRVAIKVVTGGARSGAIVRRFETERRLLATLEHPGIARLLDGGTTEDGLPYFVLEYVEGEELFAHADGRHLDVAARIRLFLEVCAAVEHAHRRLVIHRDLKPSNILVGADGRPKLLDFGIGKLLSPDGDGALERTSTLERWFTPRYASPEQISGEPTTTATDVYGLGVVLFQLLSGAPPYRFRGTSPREIESAVLEQSPRRLSATVSDPAESSARASNRSTSQARLRRQLRGDLDNIVGRTLERDPARRYASVAELSADLGRYLRGEPVLARTPSRRYRLSKFVRRNRWAVATAAAVAIALASFSTYHVVVLRRERTVAQREAAIANETAAFLTQLFQGASPLETRGATLTARDLLDRGEQRIVERSELDPTVRGRLLVTMALARESLGDLQRALELGRRAAQFHEAAGSPDEDRVYSQLLEGNFLVKLGRIAEAIPAVERAAALADDSQGVTLKTRGKVAMNLGNAYYTLGDEKRAKLAYEKHIEIEKRIGSPARIAAALNNLGAIVVNMGDDAAGRALYLESISYFERSTEKTAYEIYLPLYNLGELELKRESGDLGAAEIHYRRGMAAYEKVYGPESAEVAWGLTAIAEIDRRQGELGRARVSIDRALAIYGRVLEPGLPDWAWPLHISGKILFAEGKREGAIVELERALAIERTQGGDRSDWTRPIEETLAEVRKAASRPEESKAASGAS